MAESSLAGDAARGALTTLGAQWVRFAIQMASLALLARLLLPSDYGVISMVTALVGLATLIGDFGLSLATIQAKRLTAGQRNNLFWINASLGVLVGVVVFLLGWPIAGFFGRPELVHVTQAFSIVFLLSAVTAQFRAEATRRLRFAWMAATDISAQFLALLVGVAAALGGFGYWALVLQQLTAAVVTLVMLIIASGWLPGLPRRGEPMSALLKFGGNTFGVQLINYVSGNIDNVLIGRFWGASSLGFYDRAYQLFRLPLAQVAGPMTRVALPVLSRLQEHEAYDRYLQRAQLVLTYVMGGVFFIALVLAEPIIAIMLGPGWDQSVVLFRILALGGVFQTLGHAYYWAFLSKGKTGVQLRFSIIGRSIMVALICVGVIWGPVGVAIATVVGLFVNWLLLTIFAVPKTGIDLRGLLLAALRPLVAFAGMTALLLPIALWLAGNANVWLQLGALLGGMAVYWTVLIVSVRPIRGDLVLIIDTMKHARR